MIVKEVPFEMDAAADLAADEPSLVVDVEGFEGPLDDKQKRGAVDGWKAAGLPWAQS